MALGLLTVAASLAVEHLLPAMGASVRGAQLPCSAACGISQTRGKTCVPSTAPPGKSLDSIFLKELNLVSEGSTEVANGATVVGESFKSCSKGSPRMAGKSTRGKRDKQKKKPDPELGLLGRGWGGAGPPETLFSFTAAAAHRHL